jgi:hypothetical protein
MIMATTGCRMGGGEGRESGWIGGLFGDPPPLLPPPSLLSLLWVVRDRLSCPLQLQLELELAPCIQWDSK